MTNNLYLIYKLFIVVSQVVKINFERGIMEEIDLKTFNPPVFNDPEFCSNPNGVCRYFSNNCGLFVGADGRSKYIRHDSEFHPIKLEECKGHYLRNKTQ